MTGEEKKRKKAAYDKKWNAKRKLAPCSKCARPPSEVKVYSGGLCADCRASWGEDRKGHPCSGCGRSAPEVKVDRNGKCLECGADDARVRWPTSGRAAHLKRTYDLTTEEWDRMVEGQDGLCAICADPLGSGSKRICVDHDHETGRVRSLLCQTCNTGIGHLRDDPDLVEAAARYLREHAGSSAMP